MHKGNIIEENHYYSFGLKIAAVSSKKYADSYDGKFNNPYQYNGKEMLDDDADLNWYDYGFRNYDPQIGRFMQLDPLTDSYPFLTPYQYASNDPITNIDIDGLEGGSAVNAGFNVAGVGANLMDDATKFGQTFRITFSGFKTVTGGASKVVRNVVSKTTAVIVKAIQTANVVAKTEATYTVGRQVSEATCQNCAQREKDMKNALNFQRQQEFEERLSSGSPKGSSFNQGYWSKSFSFQPKIDPYSSTIIPNYIQETQGSRLGDFLFPLAQIGRKYLYGIAQGNAPKEFAIQLGSALVPEFKIEGILEQIFADRKLFMGWMKANQSLSRVSNPLNEIEAQQLVDNARKLGITNFDFNPTGLAGKEITGQWAGVPHFKIGNVHIPIKLGVVPK